MECGELERERDGWNLSGEKKWLRSHKTKRMLFVIASLYRALCSATPSHTYLFIPYAVYVPCMGGVRQEEEARWQKLGGQKPI